MASAMCVCVCSFATNRATQTDLHATTAVSAPPALPRTRGLIAHKGPAGPASRARDRFTAWVGEGKGEGGGGEKGRALSNAGYPSS